nr:MAG TPA: hypothetical protein [Caudoviricetes sp.]
MDHPAGPAVRLGTQRRVRRRLRLRQRRVLRPCDLCRASVGLQQPVRQHHAQRHQLGYLFPRL